MKSIRNAALWTGVTTLFLAVVLSHIFSSKRLIETSPPRTILEGYNGQEDATQVLYTNYVVSNCEWLGGRTMEFLDRQDVWCPSQQVVNAFYFERCWGDAFRSVTICKGNSDPEMISSNEKSHATDCQQGRWVWAEYLDRHNVVCPGSSILSHWRLTGDGCAWGNMRIIFWCREAEITAYREVDSPCQLLRSMPGEYFDRQRPACGDNEVMKGFRLHSDGCYGNDMRFEVHCVKLLKMPWWGYCMHQLLQLGEVRNEKLGDYEVKLAEYKSVDPESVVGRNLQEKIVEAQNEYEDLNRKYNAVKLQQLAVQNLRLFQSYSDTPGAPAAALAHDYYDTFKHLSSLVESTMGAEGMQWLATVTEKADSSASQCLLRVRNGAPHDRQPQQVKSAKRLSAGSMALSPRIIDQEETLRFPSGRAARIPQYRVAAALHRDNAVRQRIAKADIPQMLRSPLAIM